MPQLPHVERVSDIRMSANPVLEAWLYHFLTENNIEHLLNPSIVASPEQLRFMVALKDDQIYLPCDDATFFLVYRQETAELSEEYLEMWRFVTGLVHTYKMDEADTRRILALCRYRFNLFFAERMVLPSRMVKRLLSIVLSQCGDPDPFREKKQLANKRAADRLAEEPLQKLLQQCPELDAASMAIPDMRWELYLAEMCRLMILSVLEPLWNGMITIQEVEKEIAERQAPLLEVIRKVFGPENEPRKKILFIPDVAGGFIFDLILIRSLLRQGHRVVLVLKDAFYFNSPTLWDIEADPIFRENLSRAHIVTNEHLTKNELLQLLREHRLIVISDGLAEQLNLYRASISFARAWKECDVIIAKGHRNAKLLLETSHEFTRDIVACWRDKKSGAFQVGFKPRADWILQFPEQDILLRAHAIIEKMRQAKEDGKTVMFYSAVIGSIPGQTRMAIRLVNTFVADLRERLDNTFIINPAEYFEEGMDGDDLMYMWERVQRSGLLDVWRFQTVDDIERSFALMQSKVPSAWSGKDSTFSTGCTKEMRIALDVQKMYPEMQIIGPSAEKFFRRRDYGVGKYYDTMLKG